MLLFSPQGVGIGLSIPDDNLFKLTPNYYENPDVYNQVFARMIKELGYKAFITINIEAYSIIRNVLEITATALNYSYRSTLVEMDINLNDIEPYIDRAEEYLIDAIDQYGVDKVCVLVVPLWSDDSDFLNIVDSHPVFSDVTWFDIVGISEELVFEEGFARRLDKYGFIQLIMSTSESKIADDFWRNYLDNIGPLPTPAKRYGEASRYDAMWIMAHAVIQVNSSSTDNVKKILPRVCNEYQGVIGNCTLDEKGDRISTDFDIYRWITQDEKPEFKKIGHYDSETGYIRTQD
jgi:ABC-type branched-subunit amino acid transport system substrate-binding protein